VGLNSLVNLMVPILSLQPCGEQIQGIICVKIFGIVKIFYWNPFYASIDTYTNSLPNWMNNGSLGLFRFPWDLMLRKRQ
jgi:hypothetical protein